jgi:predicted GTPase
VALVVNKVDDTQHEANSWEFLSWARATPTR